MRDQASTSYLSRWLSIGVAVAVLSGCAAATSIPPQPFEEFEQSISQLKVSADKALLVEQEIVYERYLAQWIEEGDVLQLQLEANPLNPFDVKISGKSLYRDIQNARATLRQVNELVQTYAETLVLLAGSSDSPPTLAADDLANDLRRNAEALAATLEMEVEIPGGLFFGFGQLATEYIESKREDLLVQLIRDSQDEIELFAEAGRNVVKLSAFGINTEYQRKYSARTKDVSSLSESNRRKLIESLLKLNEETLRQLDTLKVLHDAYASLPGAHRGLERAVVEGKSLSFTELLAFAEMLKRRYDEFAEE